jgi:hypothetical protein
MLELVQEKDKALCTTTISSFDCCTLVFACLTYLFYEPNEELVNKVAFYIGFLAIVLYFILIPESPKWYFQVQGANS